MDPLRGRRVSGRSRPARGTLHTALWNLIFMAVSLGIAPSGVDAAYRLTFQNGTSVEVQGYEDVGDAIRYPRYGGMVTVPRTDVTAIREVLPPAPTAGPVSSLPSGGFRVTGPSLPPTRVESARPDANVLPSGRSASPQAPSTRSAAGQSHTSGGGFSAGAGLLNFVIPVLMTLVVFWLGVRKSALLRGGEGLLPYEKNSSLLSPAERSFYGVLARAVDGRYPIFAKVRLGDLLTISPGTPQFWRYRNRIDRKHVDFVLCAADDLTPVLAIELDDTSHERRSRRERDAFVDRALTAADVPILRVSAQRGYVPAELRTMIEGKLTSSATADVRDEVCL